MQCEFRTDFFPLIRANHRILHRYNSRADIKFGLQHRHELHQNSQRLKLGEESIDDGLKARKCFLFLRATFSCKEIKWFFRQVCKGDDSVSRMLFLGLLPNATAFTLIIWGMNPTAFRQIEDKSGGQPEGLYDIGPSAGGVMHYKDWQHKVQEILIMK